MKTSSPPARDPFADFLNVHRPGLSAFLARRLGPGPLADDAVQETFLRALQKRAQFDERRPLGPWLLRLAANVAEDLRRRERLRATHALDVEPEAANTERPESLAWQKEIEERLQYSLDELRPTARSVYVAFHQDFQSLAQIAQRLHLPVGTVKSHLHRARCRLAACLHPGDTP